jgi:hypothetical protein
VGFATLPLLRRSARHHFSWLEQQARTSPAWWNRGVAAAGSADHRRAEPLEGFEGVLEGVTGHADP